ncbi:MAG: hypothetical protein WBD22_06780 [Pyrinomonadaceae bacterium]
MNGRSPEIPPNKLIASLRGYNLLPAIVFMPTRRKCDESALEVAADRSQNLDTERRERRQRLFDEYAADNPEIEKHKHKKILVGSGVASHHAGHIPAWKLLVEKMMSAGLLNAIFATSTVAAGVDFPARTVVITNADTRGNDGWRPLRANELQQMTGRAGRRGKDNVGFVVLAPGQFQDPKRIAELLKMQPDPLESRFRATYTSLLNLLDAFGDFAHLREIAEKSFAFRDTLLQIDNLRTESDRLFSNIDREIKNSGLGISRDDLMGFERLSRTVQRLQSGAPETRFELRQNWLRKNVVAGRIVSKGRSGKRFFLILGVHGEKVTAMRDDGHGASFPVLGVNRVYSKKYPIKENAVESAFFDVVNGSNPAIAEPKTASRSIDEAVEILNTAVETLLPRSLDEQGRLKAHQFFWENLERTSAAASIERDIQILRDRVWMPFEKRARVLDHFGYLDFAQEKVTDNGKWLADLRVDRPLLVGETLRNGLLDDLSEQHLAGLIAALAADADRNYGELYLSEGLLDILSDLEELIFDISKVEAAIGVNPVEEINFSAAAAAERWAGRIDWNDLVNRTRAEEGDLVRLLSRTGEVLMQIAHLVESNPKAALLARLTAERLLREPVR